jgi:predicted FMN-binding regulatory protein PaiB
VAAARGPRGDAHRSHRAGRAAAAPDGTARRRLSGRPPLVPVVAPGEVDALDRLRVSRELDGPVLVIFHGPHGYVSASWYGDDTIPTWDHVTLHVRGAPERFEDAMPVLRRTVDHFEAAVERPWSLDRMGDTAREMADQVVAFRLRAESWHAEAKLSQDKSPDERARVLAGFEAPGPYANAPLAAAMRRLAR